MGVVYESGDTKNPKGLWSSDYVFASNTELPESEPLTRIKTFRFTESEAAALRQFAKCTGLAESKIVRAALKDVLEQSDRYTKQLVVTAAGRSRTAEPEFRDAINQLRRVGVNLNQAVRSGVMAEGVGVELHDKIQQLLRLLAKEV